MSNGDKCQYCGAPIDSISAVTGETTYGCGSILGYNSRAKRCYLAEKEKWYARSRAGDSSMNCPQCGVTWNPPGPHVCNVSDINRHEARRAEAARREERERERQEFIDRAVISMAPVYVKGFTPISQIFNDAEALWIEREERRLTRLERKQKSDAAG